LVIEFTFHLRETLHFTGASPVYLIAIVDWFSRRVLAWRLSITMETDFCIEALEEALTRFGAPEIFNTDSEYALASCSNDLPRMEHTD
jgi:transposase InsO family protein